MTIKTMDLVEMTNSKYIVITTQIRYFEDTKRSET